MIKKIGTFKDFKDNTLKSVFKTTDNKIIEMSLLFNKKDKDVICVPTHHFCNLGCKMCHLTTKDLKKPMLPITYDNFITCLLESLTVNNSRITNKKNLLISFMGVGEPLLNIKLIEEVYKHEEFIKKKLNYTNIGYAIATMMPNNNILTLQDLVTSLNIPLKVHFSLHNPLDNKRKELIPGSNISIEKALYYLTIYRKCLQNNKTIMDKYSKLHTNNDPIEIHYTLINNTNDGDKELNKMLELLKKYPITLKFIKFNPTQELTISKNEEKWLKTIKENNPKLRIKTYSPPGKEVGSSCGEFTKHFYHEEIETNQEKKEFNLWYQKHLLKQ